jgi:hypothetical protein
MPIRVAAKVGTGTSLNTLAAKSPALASSRNPASGSRLLRRLVCERSVYRYRPVNLDFRWRNVKGALDVMNVSLSLLVLVLMLVLVWASLGVVRHGGSEESVFSFMTDSGEL